jgi:hypothetical protein
LISLNRSRHQHACLAQPGEEPSLVSRVCRSIKDFVPE